MLSDRGVWLQRDRSSIVYTMLLMFILQFKIKDHFLKFRNTAEWIKPSLKVMNYCNCQSKRRASLNGQNKMVCLLMVRCSRLSLSMVISRENTMCAIGNSTAMLIFHSLPSFLCSPHHFHLCSLLSPVTQTTRFTSHVVSTLTCPEGICSV